MAKISRADKQRILVTGATGFVGRHLHTAVREGQFGEAEFVPPLPSFDLLDQSSVSETFEAVQPTQVVHLAAQSFVPRSFEAPEETFQVNLLGTLRLLRGLSNIEFDGRLLFVGSADIFGLVPDASLPVNETRWPEPRSPYGVSKFAAEQLCLQWSRTEGLDVVIARPFNHVGPGQDSRFVLPAMARQVVDIADGLRAPMVQVGDIDTTRDFTDVRDVVRAYAALLKSGVSGETYIVGSGKERTVREILQAMCRLEAVDPEIRQDPSRFRPAEQRRMVADPGRIRHDTGWSPTIPFDTTLQDILKDARKTR